MLVVQFLWSLLCRMGTNDVLLFVLVWWVSSRSRPGMAVSGVFVLAYGIYRFLVEFVREPDAHIGLEMLGWMTRGQELCVPMMLVGIWCFYWAYGRPQKSK